MQYLIRLALGRISFFPSYNRLSLRADEIKLWLTPSNQSLVIVCTQATTALPFY